MSSVATINASGLLHRSASKRAHDLHRIKTLIWAYVALLFLEGVLRKWVVPGFSSPLLLVRDPIAIVALWLGVRNRLLSDNKTLTALMWLGLVSVVVGLTVVNNMGTPIFGWRCNFMPIPMIYLIGKTFDQDDALVLVRWMMIAACVNSVLMPLQFFSPPSAFINATAGEGGQQLGGLSDGHIRPPGVFSFTTGPSSFYPFVLALALAFPRGATVFDRRLRIAGLVATVVGVIFSASRGCWLGCLLVLTVYLISILLLRPRQAGQAITLVLALAMAVPIFALIPQVGNALDIFVESRVTRGRTQQTFAPRVLSTFTKPFDMPANLPLTGYGLGTLTIVGSTLEKGRGSLYGYGLDGEIDTSRNIIESGPFLGGAFFSARVLLSLWTMALCWVCARKRSLIPLTLWAAFVPLAIAGQIAQTTVNGFLVVTGGMMLACLRISTSTGSQAGVVGAGGSTGRG